MIDSEKEDNMKKEEMKHYKKVNYYGHTYKLYEKVYILDHYDVREHIIIDIFDDYFSDDSDYICKCVYTTSPYGTDKRFNYLKDIYLDEQSAKYGIQNKKDTYDRYVTSRY